MFFLCLPHPLPGGNISSKNTENLSSQEMRTNCICNTLRCIGNKYTHAHNAQLLLTKIEDFTQFHVSVNSSSQLHIVSVFL